MNLSLKFKIAQFKHERKLEHYQTIKQIILDRQSLITSVRKMRVILRFLICLIIVFGSSISTIVADQAELPPKLIRSVVSIQVDSFSYNYAIPWDQPSVERAGGTGFIISGQRILTNAHVVSGAINIRVRRPDQKKDYQAKIVHTGHDCDLAMLQVEDTDFFKGADPLPIGELPTLSSSVTVVGFPIGGNRVSITRGVVSRIDLDTYAHSGIDSHLAIQVDAAINPGNSGGPALQNGKVIGVAFQALRGGENLGYLIPPVVVQKFLTEIEKTGQYRGYVELGIRDSTTENLAMRQALGIPTNTENTGVLVTQVYADTSAEGKIFAGDVLLEIQGSPISEKGEVLIDGALYPYVELVDHLSEGETIRTKVFRPNASQSNEAKKGEILSINLKAKRTTIFDYRRREYDKPPRYFLTGGLVFQPIDANLMATYATEWMQKERSDIFYDYFYPSRSLSAQNRQEAVVITRRLNDPINLYSGDYLNRIIATVNGKKIQTFQDLVAQLDTVIAKEEKIIIEFQNFNRPLILNSIDIRVANGRVKKSYSLRGDRQL